MVTSCHWQLIGAGATPNSCELCACDVWRNLTFFITFLIEFIWKPGCNIERRYSQPQIREQFITIVTHVYFSWIFVVNSHPLRHDYDNVFLQITSLGFRSLKSIDYGNVYIGFMNNLCGVELTNWTLILRNPIARANFEGGALLRHNGRSDNCSKSTFTSVKDSFISLMA